jgi:D-amino peptidase
MITSGMRCEAAGSRLPAWVVYRRVREGIEVRVYVTVDIEGMAGVVHNLEGSPGNAEYERARRLMTAEASAVVAGVYDADPNAEVLVVDVHGPYRNIIPEELDERALLNRGKPKLWGMVDGVADGFDCAMMIGVHGKAGSGPAVLSHTFTGVILAVQLNGRSLGELGLNAAMAGHYGVPVYLVAGDQSVSAEARDLFGPHVVTVEVKESRAHLAAISVHPKRARMMIREAAAKAIRDKPDIAPLMLDYPITAEVTLARPVLADLAEMIDGMERVDGRTIRFQRDDMPATYRVLRLITVLCSTPL